MENDYDTESISDSNCQDEIRPPDKVITEQLVTNTNTNNYSDFDAELMEALKLSMRETVELERKNQEYEDKIMFDFLKEKTYRLEQFKDLLFDLNKLSKYDKSIKNVYEIIAPIVDTYCEQIIDVYNLDNETYNSIFKTLSTIRTNKKNIENLTKILSTD